MKRTGIATPASPLMELAIINTTSPSWELVDELQNFRPFTSDELARLQGFDVLTESCPCAGHAKPLNARPE